MPVLTGGCLCGGVRYEIDEPLVSATYCHCTRCQRRTGTAAAPSARTAPGSFRVVKGQELIRTWQPEEGFAKAFCSNCGSALYSQDPTDPANTIGVRMGTIDGNPKVEFKHRQFTAFAAVWEPIPDDGLPRFPGPAS
jgi:hypothetical protein